MGQKSNIEWTESTWNPVRGCTRVSKGCEHCYAETVANRFSKPGQPYEGLIRLAPNGEARWNGKIKLVEEHLLDPFKWKKPRRVFVNSMSDLFHENIPDEYLFRIFAVMAFCAFLEKGHTFQILTKRIERAFRKLSDIDILRSIGTEMLRLHPLNQEEEDTLRGWLEDNWPLKNVWLGVSCEDQVTADERIPVLLQTPAAIRWVSAEPLLGQIDFGMRNLDHNFSLNLLTGEVDADSAPHHYAKIDWIVVGGESGKGARPFNIEWARDIIEQCESARVPVFMKQTGSKPVTSFDLVPLHGITGKGGNPMEWPEDLRVRQYPKTTI